MSISALTSAFSQTQLSGTNPYQQQLQQLGQALQSGNLSSAQSNFATLQQAFSQTAATTGNSTTTSNPVYQAFNQLGSDLQSGNLAAAQKDLSTVKQDLKGYDAPLSTVRFQHHSPVGPGRDSSVDQNSLLQDLNLVGQSLTSGSPASAQQAYSTLQQQLQQFALGGEDSEDLSNMPISLVA
jgi:hypothetical protein